MSDARDTGAFARFLMAGMGQGIQLGQNADSMRFARERAGVADKNTAFQQALQLDDAMLRRQQIAQAARDRVEQRERMERSRKANAQLVALSADPNFQFNLNDPSVMPVLEDASPEVQSLVFRAAGDANAKKQLADSAKRAQETYRSFTAMGGKYTLDRANELLKMGIQVDPKHIVKSQQEMQAQQEAQDKEGYLVLLAEDFGVPADRIQKLQGASVDLVRKVYEDAKTAKQAAEKAAAEAQSTQALQQPLARYRSGQATEADLLALKQGGLITASQIEPSKPMENPLVFAEKQAQRVDGEIQRLEQELLNQGVATKEKGAFRLDDEKVKEGDGTGWFDGDATPEYARRQELLKQRDALMKQREAIGSALVKQQLGPIIAQLESQLGRKPTRDEVRAALGAPRSTQAGSAQVMPQQPR